MGIFIGIVVGLGLAAGVAYWLMRNNPALSFARHADESQAASTEAASTAPAPAPGKPRFDFYKILPGVEDAKPQPDASRAASRAAPAPAPAAIAPAAVPATSALPATSAAARTQAPAPTVSGGAGSSAKPAPHSWLQAGSFTTEADAENLKARLALAGLEASVQAGALPDGSTRYRVRLGPYDNADELARMKSELAKRGFDVAVIRS